MKAVTGYVYDTCLFLRSWYDSPTRMGAWFPSFARTGKMLAGIIRDVNNAKVVELGAGTGQVTEQIIATGIKPENFVTIEFDQGFCKALLEKHPKGLNLLNIDAAKMEEELPNDFMRNVDYVISTLPLITLGEKKAKEVIEAVFKVMKPGGVYIQITYTPYKPKYMKELGLKATKLCISWLNLPPTHIWRICQKKPSVPSE